MTIFQYSFKLLSVRYIELFSCNAIVKFCTSTFGKSFNVNKMEETTGEARFMKINELFIYCSKRGSFGE